ncbi:unnamed protein product [Heligmosomoides polygyrus]|uniref:Fibronectin type-III domain-containing protein n=1 Tax=Heligmosomoides polygyrus TaxID=6339 RepID=A0A3P7YM37_HELPZ|nr:unnamed protein product [Heligmosomoides polygyrus]
MPVFRAGVPRCESNYDCVHNGLCRKDADGYGRCLCPRKFQFQGRCSCPPMFDNWKSTDLPVLNLLPTKCDRRELAVLGIAYPSDAVYKGTDVTLYCCVNMDPQGLIDVAGVLFVQNTTVVREPTNHPFHHMNTPYCWELEIRNVQLTDSGSYMCHVNANQQPSVNYTIEFQVKAPRTIQNLTIVTNDVSANVSWDVQQGPQLKIGLRLVRRTGLNGQEVFSQMNAISPVTISNLRAATPYKLFVTVNDSQTDPLTKYLTYEPFTFSEPHPPKYEDVRVLNSGSSLICEVEWRAPALTNGRISRYYVGSMFSWSHEVLEWICKCANWDEREDATHGINPIEFTTEFLSCKYGPLKPNRNYTITVWAENSAGRSSPLVFPKNCITNYAQPDVVTLYPSQTSLCQFTDPGGMKGLVDLGGKSEPRTLYRVQATVGASSDCATRAHSFIYLHKIVLMKWSIYGHSKLGEKNHVEKKKRGYSIIRRIFWQFSLLCGWWSRVVNFVMNSSIHYINTTASLCFNFQLGLPLVINIVFRIKG